MSFFGYDNWRAAREEPDGERVGDGLLEPAEGAGQRLGAKLSPELDRLEDVSPENLTPRQFRDLTDIPDEPKHRSGSTDQQTETGAEVGPLADGPGELSPALVRWLTGHMESRPPDRGSEKVAAQNAGRESEQAGSEPELTKDEGRHVDPDVLDNLIPDRGEYVETDQPELTDADVDAVAQHLARLDHSPANDAMTSRIREAIANERPLTEGERNFMTHELTEAELMDGGMPYEEAHELAGQAHPPMKNYDPEVIEQFPELFNNNWRRTWGLEPR